MDKKNLRNHVLTHKNCEWIECPMCHGKREIPIGILRRMQNCPKCNGRGEIEVYTNRTFVLVLVLVIVLVLMFAIPAIFGSHNPAPAPISFLQPPHSLVAASVRHARVAIEPVAYTGAAKVLAAPVKLGTVFDGTNPTTPPGDAPVWYTTILWWVAMYQNSGMPV